MSVRIDSSSGECKALLSFFRQELCVDGSKIHKLACFMYKEKERAKGKKPFNGKVSERRCLPFYRTMKGLKKEELEALFVMAGIVPPPPEEKDSKTDKVYKDEQGNVSAIVHQGEGSGSLV